MNRFILVINPGSTSTKIAVYNNRNEFFLINVKHDKEILSKFDSIFDQFEYRKNMIKEILETAEIDLKKMAIIVGRGGLFKPIDGGVYKVNEAMLNDVKNPMGEHESNLGGVIAYELAREIGGDVMAIIVDPTCVDEMDEIARLSGVPELPRRSLFHALNQRAIARRFAKEINKEYSDINVIVAHLGGGISVGAHCKGKIIDVNNGLNGDGPMSPERSGSLPVGQLVDLCFSQQFTQSEIIKKIKGVGGLYAYLGTSDAIEIEKRIEQGDIKAKLVYDAMCYQVAKEIGALGTVLKGDIDAILLTGGIAFSELVTRQISERVKRLAPVKIYPGEGEMDAMALNGYLVLSGEICAQEYV